MISAGGAQLRLGNNSCACHAIRNTDISALYVETHCDVDLIQMSGRVREGFETMYVMTDAAVFGVGVSKLEYMFSKEEVLVNAFEPTEEGDAVKGMNLNEFINSYFKGM